MSDTDSNPEYPELTQNSFDTHSVPVEYPEVIEPSTTPLPSLPTFPRPKTPVMAPGESSSSGKNPEFSFSTRVNKKTQVNVKLDSISKLTGQDNYRIWSASMNIVLKGIKAYISKRHFRPGGMAPSEWTCSVRAVRDTPVADYSAPSANRTRHAAYRPPIAVSSFRIALSVFYCKRSLWGCGQL